MPIVHLAELDKLRFDFPVPESIVSTIKVGMPLDISIQADGQVIHGQVARMSDKVDSATRTMEVEADLDNSDLRLKPGVYATANIALNPRVGVLAVPVETVATGTKPTVWVINADHVIVERPVTLGLQTADKIEITSGISVGDILVYGNRGGHKGYGAFLRSAFRSNSEQHNLSCF